MAPTPMTNSSVVRYPSLVSVFELANTTANVIVKRVKTRTDVEQAVQIDVAVK